jgi:hypothetical protein
MKKSLERTILSRRRALLLGATAGLSVAGAPLALSSDSIKTGAHQEPGNCSTPRSAVAKTQCGKVRGFLAARGSEPDSVIRSPTATLPGGREPALAALCTRWVSVQ